GIIWHANGNHAAYLANWNAALTHAKDDNKFLFKAAAAAQKAADFVLQFDADGNPKYLSELKAKIEVPKPLKKYGKKRAFTSRKKVKQDPKRLPPTPVKAERRRRKKAPEPLGIDTLFP